MGQVTITELTEDQQNVNHTEFNNLVTPLLNEFNGSIDNTNIDTGANIAYSKLSLGGSILNADVNASAAIAGTKIDPDFGAQNIETTGTITVSGAASIGGALTVPGDLPTGWVRQIVNVTDGAVSTGTTTMPRDDTIPQNDEGDEVMTLAITPTDATNNLKIDVVVNAGNTNSGCGTLTAALFQDTTAGALAAMGNQYADAQANTPRQVVFTHFMTAGTASETTFKVRIGSNLSGTTTFNGTSGSRKMGGIMASSITITEIEV